MTLPITMPGWSGELHADYGALQDSFDQLPQWMADGDTLIAGRNRVVRVSTCEGEIAIKSFGRRSAIKDLADRRRGTRAHRSWDVAHALKASGVGTPAPVGYLERWEGRRLAESYFISRYVEGLTDLRHELIHIYRNDPICWKLMSLLQTVADGIRGMHEAGVAHYDLGNQNVHLRRMDDGEWGDVCFLDLNRARVKERLTDTDIARDLSRLYLPSALLRVFKEMYFGARPVAAFDKLEDRFRRRYALHSATRKYRHPIRSRRQQADPSTVYPHEKDMWIWDDRSVQAINVVGRKDRNRMHRYRDTFAQIATTAIALPPVWGRYRRLLDTCYTQPVSMAKRVGIAVEPGEGDEDRELEWLTVLGEAPVLLRYYHHQGLAGWDRTSALVERLAAGGREVGVAMVQDRSAVNDPASWNAFLEQVLDRVHEAVTWVEIGHAVNRVKWGIWTLAEQRRLLARLPALQKRYRGLRFLGPAGIDFEYPYSLTALRGLPWGGKFYAFSQHLYVDRRGAPENPQGPFSTLEKCALARAIAGWVNGCEDRLVVSEVNWPLMKTGVYSPVVSPYDTPGPRGNDPSVTEEEYGAYMIRYLLITICSGMVERVYWWRLVARGFGLIDDTDPDQWRARPAFHMLAAFLRLVGAETFVARREVDSGIYYWFETSDGKRNAMGYTLEAKKSIHAPISAKEIRDAVGEVCTDDPVLSGAPTYYLDVKEGPG